jgi:hypothetical protein
MKRTYIRIFAMMLVLIMLLTGVVPAAMATTCVTHVRTREVTQQPTCTEPGYYIGVCAVCGAR